MSRKTFHQTFYLLGAITLAVAIPLSHFLMGLACFLLFLNWLAEWNWTEKQRYLRKSRQGLWFSVFYLVYAIGLVHVTDWGVAGSDMLSKLPFLITPLIIITSKPFNSRDIRYIFTAFILATLVGCGWNFFYAQTHHIVNLREMSRFIDHIRFSLCIVLSVVLCVHYSLRSDTLSKYIYLVVCLLLIIYLVYSQTLSGIIILMLIMLCYLIYLIVNKTNKSEKWLFWSLMALFLLVIAGYVTYITYDYFHVKDPAPDRNARTALGNPYQFDENPMVENGHFIGNYVCESELQNAWAQRSDTAYNDLIAVTLVRYLNSIGLRKDSAAVAQLCDEDIRHIEQKIANAYYVRRGHLRRALYETYFGFTLYEKYGIINESSMLERIELWQATWRIIQDHWLFGVGVGQQRAALDRQLELQHSSIAYKKKNRGSHNQFLTFWLAAGIIPMLYFCFLLVFPFVKLQDRITFVYFAFLLALFLSMLVEDTLNAQTGRMIFTFFVPLLLFNDECMKS